MYRPKNVDDYITHHAHFETELRILRDLLLDTDLKEEIKWSLPTYTLKGKNVVSLGAFSSHFGIWFHQGALLSDPHGLLINAQEGKTQAMRHFKMSGVSDIDLEQVRSYILEAIENEAAGKRVKMKKNPQYKPGKLPSRLKTALSQHHLMEAFDKLSPGKQRDYCKYIEGAKREETKLSRLNKILPLIKSGKGLNDAYRKS